MKRTKKPWVEIVTVGQIEVRITRREGYKKSTRYIVHDYSTGERKQPSFGDLELARQEANRIGNIMSQWGVQNDQITKDEGLEFFRARTVLKPFGLAVGTAAELLAQLLTKAGDIHKVNEAMNFYFARHTKITNKPVQEVVNDLLDQKRKDKASERYIGSLKPCFNRFAKSFVCNIGDITTPQVKTWIDGIGKEPQTRVNNRRMLNVLFEYAVEYGYAHDNPVKKVKRPNLKPKDTPIYTPDQILKLLNVCEADILPCIAIGAFAGLRPNEILRLHWSDVDMIQKHIKVKTGIAKTASRRIVPIQDNLLSWLADYKDAKGKVWKGKYFPFYRKQKKTYIKAEVELLDDALRHSYGSYRLAQTQNAAQVALEMGNSETVVYKHYIELVTKADAQIYFDVKPEVPGNVVLLANKA